jgi:hypothetical protein
MARKKRCERIYYFIDIHPVALYAPRVPAINKAPLIGYLDLQQNPTLADQFLAPLLHVLANYVRQKLDCPEISDADFLRLGCWRVLSQVQSGRDFIQQQQEMFDSDLKRSSFFAVLHSRRRRDLLAECSWQLYLQGSRQLCRARDDLLAAFPQLEGRPVWAVDGHQIAHACHALKDSKGNHVPPNSLYLLCLHTGLLQNLSPVQGEGIYRHEMPIFRQHLPGWLQKQPQRRKGHPPILVLDPAFVDKQFWSQMTLLRSAGAVMIIRAKENMKPEVYSRFRWAVEDPVNVGIQGDFLVGFDGSVGMRWITYVDPESGETYEFLTTDKSLPPGLIAWLYLLRWRIEKVFDTGKNKLLETKAWATGEVAQAVQAHFLALTHNLLVLFRHYLQSEHGLEEVKLIRKREDSLRQRDHRATDEGRQIHPLHKEMPPVVQLSVQFIRTLRNQISQNNSLASSLARLAAMLNAYL